MGFKDAGWAYELDLPMIQKVVLAAVCLKTDDKTHQTIVGQQRVASMVGSSAVSVRRALGALEAAGVITRTRRYGVGGYRTSDLTTVNIDSYRSDSPQGSEPTRPSAHKALSARLPITETRPTDQSDRAEEVIQSQPESHTDTRRNRQEYPEAFEEFWNVYPRKEAKADAFKAYRAATKTEDPATILTGAQKYRLATIGSDVQFVKLAGGWLRGKRWLDEPTVREPKAQPASDWWKRDDESSTYRPPRKDEEWGS